MQQQLHHGMWAKLQWHSGCGAGNLSVHFELASVSNALQAQRGTTQQQLHQGMQDLLLWH